MSISYHNSMNNAPGRYANLTFGADNSSAPLAKPIEKVRKSIENVTDTFVKTPEDENHKKTKKTTIAVISSVLVLSGIVALLNPKFSSKWLTKLKNKQAQAKNRAADSKNPSAIQKIWSNMLDGGVKTLGFVNNFNTMKDIGFKKLCSNKVLKKPHETITGWFDFIGKHTVQSKYKTASKKMDSFESLALQYKEKLPQEVKKELDIKLKEAAKTREFFSKENVSARFNKQEASMSNLESRTKEKIQSYFSGLKDVVTGKNKDSKNYLKDNMTFWAQDLVQPQRDIIEQEGKNTVAKLIGNTAGEKGKYNEILEIMNPYLSSEEKNLLEKSFKKAGKRLQKANYSECVEYFDKKRDLILGGAPTDIVTGATFIGLGGIAISNAQTKEEKISKSVTVGIPAVLGVVTSIVSTAMLLSGVQGMVIGTAVSGAISVLGNMFDRYILGHKPQNATNNKEVTYA